MCVCWCVCVSVCVCACPSLETVLYIYVYTWVCVSVCVCGFFSCKIFIYIYICIYVCVWRCACVCVLRLLSFAVAPARSFSLSLFVRVCLVSVCLSFFRGCVCRMYNILTVEHSDGWEYVPGDYCLDWCRNSSAQHGQKGKVCCSLLQRVAACCSALRCVAVSNGAATAPRNIAKKATNLTKKSPLSLL